jgi:hypothetical protein
MLKSYQGLDKSATVVEMKRFVSMQMPEDLIARLDSAAVVARRSRSQEMLLRLEQSFGLTGRTERIEPAGQDLAPKDVQTHFKGQK